MISDVDVNVVDSDPPGLHRRALTYFYAEQATTCLLFYYSRRKHATQFLLPLIDFDILHYCLEPLKAISSLTEPNSHKRSINLRSLPSNVVLRRALLQQKQICLPPGTMVELVNWRAKTEDTVGKTAHRLIKYLTTELTANQRQLTPSLYNTFSEVWHFIQTEMFSIMEGCDRYQHIDRIISKCISWQEVLHADSYTPTSDDWYHSAYKHFEHNRPHKGINNAADAANVWMLATLYKRSQNPNTSHLFPLLITNTPTVNGLIERRIGPEGVPALPVEMVSNPFFLLLSAELNEDSMLTQELALNELKLLNGELQAFSRSYQNLNSMTPNSQQVALHDPDSASLFTSENEFRERRGWLFFGANDSQDDERREFSNFCNSSEWSNLLGRIRSKSKDDYKYGIRRVSEIVKKRIWEWDQERGTSVALLSSTDLSLLQHVMFQASLHDLTDVAGTTVDEMVHSNWTLEDSSAFNDSRILCTIRHAKPQAAPRFCIDEWIRDKTIWRMVLLPHGMDVSQIVSMMGALLKVIASSLDAGSDAISLNGFRPNNSPIRLFGTISEIGDAMEQIVHKTGTDHHCSATENEKDEMQSDLKEPKFLGLKDIADCDVLEIQGDRVCLFIDVCVGDKVATDVGVALHSSMWQTRHASKVLSYFFDECSLDKTANQTLIQLAANIMQMLLPEVVSRTNSTLLRQLDTGV